MEGQKKHRFNKTAEKRAIRVGKVSQSSYASISKSNWTNGSKAGPFDRQTFWPLLRTEDGVFRISQAPISSNGRAPSPLPIR